MQKKNILVLGASGLIGTALFDKLAESKGYNVFGAMRSVEDKAYKKNAAFVHWEIEEEPSKTVIDLSREYDCIVVNAWDGNQKEKRENWEANKNCADRILALLEYICINGKVHQIILCGSALEYGKIVGKAWEECSIEESSLSAYGRAKLYLYRSLQNAHICEILTELRFHSVFGYQKNSKQMLLMVLEKLYYGKQVYLATDCLQKQNFLYVDDAAEAIVFSIKEKIKGVYNVGADEDFTLRDYIKQVEDFLHKPGLIQFGTDHNQEGFSFPSDKFRSITGWEERYCFIEGIKKIVDKLEENREDERYEM